MLIDFHTHTFPSKIAPKALGNLGDVIGGKTPEYDGTIEGLLRYMDECGVDKSVVLGIASTPGQQKSVNDYAKSIESNRIIPFGSVHPFADDALEEIDRICEMGLKGVKFHPDYQKFYVDDEKAFPVYKKLGEKGLVVSFHAGIDPGLYPPVGFTPEGFKKALHHLEGAKVVAAHFGGHLMYDDVLKYLCGEDLYFDTAYAFGIIPTKIAHEIVERQGADRILFGTDGPWSSPINEKQLMYHIGISDEERELIFHKNAEKLLDLK